MKIVIDGNIGSGKTTQLELLSSLGFNIRYEPIDKWPLELFYSDMERWGLTFQMVVLQTFEIDKTPNTIYERCPLSSKEIFWKAMKKTPLEDEVYQKAFDLHGWGPDLYILIDKPPDVCFEHIQIRTQSGDGGVTKQYLEELHKNYNTMFDNVECTKIKINGNQSVRKVHNDIVAHLVKHGYLLTVDVIEKSIYNTLKPTVPLLGEVGLMASQYSKKNL